MNAPKRPRCRAITKAGNPCRAAARPGYPVCAVHGAASKPLGARSRLNRATADRLIEIAAVGSYHHVAAAAVGVTPDTYLIWRTRGHDDLAAGRDTPHAYLAAGLAVATAEAEAAMVRVIRRAAELTDWRAGAWYLERKHPDRWARRDTLDVTTSDTPASREVNAEGDRRDTILGILAAAVTPPPES